MKITFCGAAGEVTGSQHLLEIGAHKILLDCGLFQGHRAESRRKNEHFIYQASQIDAVILSHAHIDHCGNLPSLTRWGYEGPVFMTPPTGDVCEIMLQDSLHIQQEDAKYLNRKHGPTGLQVEPLYGERDVRGITRDFVRIPYHRWHDILDDVRIRFSDAGHILGSAITEIEFTEKGDKRRLVFTGDLGRRGLPLLRDPELIEGCDILISESTYGNRVHEPASNIKAELKRIVHEAVKVGGRVIIPAFSLGRTQQLVYFLNELVNDKELPQIPMFVDSPLSRRLTTVYREHLNVFDGEVKKTLEEDNDPFGFRGLTYVGNQTESMKLNDYRGSCLILAASGMCESGRVLHHLKHAVENELNTIVIIGFQAENTLGRRLRDRLPRVRIHDRDYELRAHVEILEGLSAHADVEDFRWWFGHMAKTGGIGQAFLVHGESASSQALSTVMRDFCDEEVVIPTRGQSVEV